MKSTILIYKNPDMPESGLREASREEWTQILKANRGLPRDSRRFFICDSFEDCGIIDRAFSLRPPRPSMIDGMLSRLKPTEREKLATNILRC